MQECDEKIRHRLNTMLHAGELRAGTEFRVKYLLWDMKKARNLRRKTGEADATLCSVLRINETEPKAPVTATILRGHYKDLPNVPVPNPAVRYIRFEPFEAKPGSVSSSRAGSMQQMKKATGQQQHEGNGGKKRAAQRPGTNVARSAVNKTAPHPAAAGAHTQTHKNKQGAVVQQQLPQSTPSSGAPSALPKTDGQQQSVTHAANAQGSNAQRAISNATSASP